MLQLYLEYGTRITNNSGPYGMLPEQAPDELLPQAMLPALPVLRAPQDRGRARTPSRNFGASSCCRIWDPCPMLSIGISASSTDVQQVREQLSKIFRLL